VDFARALSAGRIGLIHGSHEWFEMFTIHGHTISDPGHWYQPCTAMPLASSLCCYWHLRHLDCWTDQVFTEMEHDVVAFSLSGWLFVMGSITQADSEAGGCHGCLYCYVAIPATLTTWVRSSKERSSSGWFENLRT
jgi:hypothetical protein